MTEPGRVERVRLRAEKAADRYQGLARRHPLLGVPVVWSARHVAEQGVLLASALAFRLFAWLVPLSLLLAGVLAGFSIDDSEDIGSAARTAGITGAASHEVVTTLKDGNRSWWLAVLVGGVLFLWATRALVTTLTSIHMVLWHQPRPVRKHRAVIVNALVLDATWLVLLVAALGIRKADHLLPAGAVLTTLLEALVVAVAWLLISMRLPHGPYRWTSLVPGSVLVGVGLTVLHVISRSYIPRRLESSSELYGSLGLAVVILFWLLVIAELIVGSALLNVVLVEHHAATRLEDPSVDE